RSDRAGSRPGISFRRADGPRRERQGRWDRGELTAGPRRGALGKGGCGEPTGRSARSGTEAAAPGDRRPPRSRLLTDAELLDDGAVALDVARLEVGEEPTALADHPEQAA